MAGTLWTKEEDEIILKNIDSMMDKELINLLPNRTINSIGLRARFLGVSDRRHRRKYKINMKFFDEPSIENSYFAGFIAADGCMTIKKHCISFGLKAEDGYLLENLVNLVGFEGSVSYGTYNGYDRAALYIWGVKPWFEPLQKIFNITPKKSLTLQPPNLFEEECVKSFIKGYIDGDGGIYIRTSINTPYLSIRGTKEMLNWICEWFNKLAPPSNHFRIAKPYFSDGYGRYSTSGERTLCFLIDLFKLPTPYLKRKWTPIKEYIEEGY